MIEGVLVRLCVGRNDGASEVIALLGPADATELGFGGSGLGEELGTKVGPPEGGIEGKLVGCEEGVVGEKEGGKSLAVRLEGIIEGELVGCDEGAAEKNEDGKSVAVRLGWEDGE